jgi:phospholipase C
MALVALVLAIGAFSPAAPAPRTIAAAAASAPIKHVVVIMEENHSFDNYFGTFPGANGIPAGVCLTDPSTHGCDPPYHNPAGYSQDLPHHTSAGVVDINNGRMDGFVQEEQAVCKCSQHQAMGYFDATDIPVFWRYAKTYALQDNLFEQVLGWSYPSHLAMVSDWSASCTSPTDPMSCTGNPNLGFPNWKSWPASNTLPWTDLTYILHRGGVSWGYYNANGTQPICVSNSCTLTPSNPGTPVYWNPLPWFTDVQQDGDLGNIRTQSAFYNAVAGGTLPAVSWVIPSPTQSGHPSQGVNAGSEQYVVSLVNAIESSPEWNSTAIFLEWDDWGGEYDHVPPPTVDGLGFGLRVASMLISPYAKHGYIDHQALSVDAINKFIEDTFLNGQRLDPANDGRPDSRPTVRENNPLLGDLSQDFDFTQPPSAPVLLPVVTAPTREGPSAAMTVGGTHFLPGDPVKLTFNCAAPDCSGGTPLGTAVAGPDGSFTITVTAPANLRAGAYFVSAAGSDPLTYFGITSTTLTNKKGKAPVVPVSTADPD